ncbi:MAG: FAD-dependent oxidoreductase, partial [Anaerolineales bacterium]|nr:FAD-dependent oxidoreductase [Anaerolineales bacterium]
MKTIKEAARAVPVMAETDVLVVGSGPAGLAAAFQLRKKGHGVTIFDEHPELGGMMRFGIPGYRTPRDVLDGEIQR